MPIVCAGLTMILLYPHGEALGRRDGRSCSRPRSTRRSRWPCTTGTSSTCKDRRSRSRHGRGGVLLLPLASHRPPRLVGRVLLRVHRRRLHRLAGLLAARRVVRSITCGRADRLGQAGRKRAVLIGFPVVTILCFVTNIVYTSVLSRGGFGQILMAFTLEQRGADVARNRVARLVRQEQPIRTLDVHAAGSDPHRRRDGLSPRSSQTVRRRALPGMPTYACSRFSPIGVVYSGDLPERRVDPRALDAVHDAGPRRRRRDRHSGGAPGRAGSAAVVTSWPRPCSASALVGWLGWTSMRALGAADKLRGRHTTSGPATRSGPRRNQHESITIVGDPNEASIYELLRRPHGHHTERPR